MGKEKQAKMCEMDEKMDMEQRRELREKDRMKQKKEINGKEKKYCDENGR